MKACEQTYMADMVYVVAFPLVPYCRGGGQMSSERLVYTTQHYTLCNTRSCRLGKVIKDSTGDHSLSVCDLLRKMVLARAWSEGLDSMASSGKQEEILF